MAGRKGSDSEKQLTFVFGADTSQANKDVDKLGDNVEKVAKSTDKVNKNLDDINKKSEKINDTTRMENLLRKETTEYLAKKGKALVVNDKLEKAFNQQRLQEERNLEKERKKNAQEETRRTKEKLKLELDGIIELKQKIYELKQQQKDLQKTGYGALVNAFGEGFPARLGTALAYKSIGTAMETIRDSLGSLVGLQQQFAAIYAITDSTSAAMEKLRGTIMDVGTASIYSTEQLAQATITLGQAGLSAEQIVDALEAVNNLAVGTGTDLSMSVNVLTSSLAVWNKEASQAGHVADVLTTAANRTRADVGTMANAIQYAGAAASDLGVSFEEFASVASAVTNAGLKARSVVGTGFRSVLTELINPSAKLKKVFDQLGVSLDDVDVRSRGLVNVLKTLKEAGLDAAMAFQGFDRRAASFFVAATSQLDTVDKLRDAFLQEGAAAKAAEKQLDTFSGQLNRLTNAMKAAFSDAFRPLVGALAELLKIIADFVSTGLGKFITMWMSVGTVILSAKTAVIGLIKAYKELAVISATITTLTKELTAATITAETGIIALLKKTVVGLLAFLKAHWVTALISGAILGLSYLYKGVKSSEEALDEANDKIKASEDRINSLTDAYNELVQKQKLYYSDQDALITRGRELNRQFDLQGAAILNATDKLEDYLVKMQLVIKATKEEQLVAKQAALEALRQKVMEDTGNNPSWWDAITHPLTDPRFDKWRKIGKSAGVLSGTIGGKQISPGGVVQNQIMDLIDTKKYGALGDYLAFVENRINKSGDYDEEEKKELIKALNSFATDVLRMQELEGSIDRLKISVDNGVETAKDLAKAAINLGNFGQKYQTQLGLALGGQDFDKVFGNLVSLANQMEQEYQTTRGGYAKTIESAKNAGDTDKQKKFEALMNQLDLDYNEIMEKYLAKEKDLINKRVQKASTAFQDWAKAVEHGETGKTPEEAAKKLEELKDGLKKAIDQQLEYETMLLNSKEARRIKGVEAKIQRIREGKEPVEEWFQLGFGSDKEGAKNAFIELLKPTAEISAEVKQAIADLKRDAEAKFTQLTSRAYAAGEKNANRSGSTFGSLLPYTAALYGGANSPGFAPLIEKYQQSNFLGRGANLYGQKLFGDKSLTDFMDDAWAQTALKGIDTFTEGFSDAVTEFANSSKKFKDAMQDFASSSLRIIGNWLIQMSIKAAVAQGLKMMFPEFFEVSSSAGATASAATTAAAAGGYVSGGIPNRDSVNAKLMPGEYVLKKSAVDYLGKNFLNSLNTNAAQTMSTVAGDIVADEGSPASIVNVWVVSDEEEAGMGPNDVIATITKDIRNGGQTRQLIKSIVAGRK